ncbi:MAG: hypothetical protein HEP71_04540 [Roseivirga sp.]|nr:hypothetical protein [Roseivirga sp.]
MKRLALLLLTCFTLTSVSAQEAKTGDVESVDAIIAALYDVISGPAGEKRDWDRMKSLFIPEGRLIPTFKKPDGKVGYLWWSIQEYIDQAGAGLEKNGFFEVEVARKQENYGTVVHLFSTYESRRNLDDEKPFARGINSIQLMYDSERWWIMNVFWRGESPDNKIPQAYLPGN